MFLSQIRAFAAVLFLPLVSSLKIASALSVLEWTPQLIAKEDYAGSSDVTIVNGGIASLFGSSNDVDLGANSETQLLRQYGEHKNLRTIFTIVEVYYRIVANRWAGNITELADLRGKRIGAVPSTSSEYSLQTYLDTVGLRPADYTVVSGQACLLAPCGAGTFPEMLRRGAIDAIGMWEPSVELGIRALGADNAVVFGDNQTAYREVYNLATTTEKLGDPAKRGEIVAFLRALLKAEVVFRDDPEKVIPRVAAAVGTDAEALRSAWPVHRWTARVPPDVLDVLVEEDRFVAAYDRRAAMPRDVLAQLVDTSVLEEALAGA